MNSYHEIWNGNYRLSQLIFRLGAGAMINQQVSPNSIKPGSFDHGVGGLRRNILFKYEIVKQNQHVKY